MRRDGATSVTPRSSPKRDAHARTAEQHHNLFVRRFIEQPAENLDESFLRQITASGPPLPVLLHALEALRDKRMAAPRTDIETRFADLQRLRAACVAGADDLPGR